MWIVSLIEANKQIAVEVLIMVGLRLFCLVAHSHRKLEPTQVCLWNSSSCSGLLSGVFWFVRFSSLLPHSCPHFFFLGTPGYISKRIKCDEAFYWRVLKVYFPIGTLLSRYSDYLKGNREKTLLPKLFYFWGCIKGPGSTVLCFVLMNNMMWYPSDCIEKLLGISKKCLQVSSQQCFYLRASQRLLFLPRLFQAPLQY